MSPTEVVILNVEILLACASLIVLVNDLFFGAVMVAGQYGAVHIFHAGQKPLSCSASILVRCTTSRKCRRKGIRWIQMTGHPSPGRLPTRDANPCPVHTSVCGPHSGWLGGRTSLSAERVLNKFLVKSRNRHGTWHKVLNLDIVQHACQLFHLLKLDIRLPSQADYRAGLRPGSSAALWNRRLFSAGMNSLSKSTSSPDPFSKEAAMPCQHQGFSFMAGSCAIRCQLYSYGYTHGLSSFSPGRWCQNLPPGGSDTCSDGGYILYMITATEVNTEYRKHDIAVLIAIVRRGLLYRCRSCAFKFVHSIKIPRGACYHILLLLLPCHLELNFFVLTHKISENSAHGKTLGNLLFLRDL